MNERLTDECSLVNADPADDGWLFKMKVADAAELDTLLDEQAYTYKVLTTAHVSESKKSVH